MAAAVNDFFGRRPIGAQPIEFPHDAHIANFVTCDTCHEGVMTGPVAGLPSVKICLDCHEGQSIATENPVIQQITGLRDKGIDLNWNRVYGYVPEAAVRFNHAPHIRAKVECSTCHGNLDVQTVAQRSVDLNMGFCVNCHRENNAPVDCLTCHF
jgi:formylmethanofuran dehydrogenase subunit E